MEDYYFLFSGFASLTEQYRIKNQHVDEVRTSAGTGSIQQAVVVYAISEQQAETILSYGNEQLEKVKARLPQWTFTLEAIPSSKISDIDLLHLVDCVDDLVLDWQGDRRFSTEVWPEYREIQKITWAIRNSATRLRKLQAIQQGYAGPGRPANPRKEWIAEQHRRGLTPAQIRDKWDAGGPELWDAIDPDNAKPYNDGSKDWNKRAISSIKGFIRRSK